MKIILGLGNPETKYDNTYHNVGFFAIDRLAQKFNVAFTKKYCEGVVAEAYYHREKILLVKPQTFMNLSGNCALALKNKFKIDTKNIYVILDDIDLKKGTVRFRESGSGGTHNGLKNIVLRLGTEDIPRLRIGIGRDEKMDLASYVLSRIDEESKKLIEKATSDGLELLLEKVKENNANSN